MLEETELPNPSFPPYYPPEFFDTIVQVRDASTLDIATMTTSQWSKVLLEVNVTMTTQPDNTRYFTLCRAELTHPGNNWELT